MKKTPVAKLIIVSLMLVSAVAFVSPTTQAASQPMGASVTLSELPLDLTLLQDMYFGGLTIPTDVNAIWTLSAIGVLSKTGGNSQHPLLGDHRVGSIRITGQPGTSVNFAVAVTTDFAGPELTLSNLSTNFPSPKVLSDPGGVFSVGVGGVLTITPAATPGLHNDAIITLTANY